MVYVLIGMIITIVAIGFYADNEILKANNKRRKAERKLNSILDKTIELVVKNSEDAVYYDKVNDVIIIREDLEYVGKL